MSSIQVAAPDPVLSSSSRPSAAAPVTPAADDNRRVLLYPVHRTVAWWRYVGQNLGWGDSVVVTDLRGEGDISVVDDFYRELGRLRAQDQPQGLLLSPAEEADVVARCRLLRWLDRRLAGAMAQAMALAMDRVLAQVDPRVVLSFPIDRYVTDVLERRAHARGIKYLELTASVVPRMSMLLYRGALVQVKQPPPAALVQQTVQEIASPAFVPTYVQKKSKYTKGRFVRTLGYFRVRALAFKLISWIKRDPLNLHYMDAQPFLGHKCRWKDIRMVDLCDAQWRDKLAAFPQERRVMFGLQLFPEASIDYWLRNVDLIDHENLVVDAARSFSAQGFLVLVKDHPSQFGFRHTDLIDRLLAIPNVVMVPYDVSGNELMAHAGVNFTCTGTLGLQAALAGLPSVVTESYYAADDDFLIFRERQEVAGLGQRVLQHQFSAPLDRRRERIISHLLRGSFEADFFSFQGFDPASPSAGAKDLAQALGQRLDQLIAEGQL
jgi:hypothetical protein